jgi:hypothetical protein
MAITTLLAYWIHQKAKVDAALSAAQPALTAAQTDLATQRGKLSAANQALADLAKQTAQIRAALAEAATPADVEALTPKLGKAISDTRAKQAEIIVIEAAIDAAQTVLDLATAGVAAATERASAVAAALEAADQQDKDLAKVGAGLAVRASSSVTISGLTGHPFIITDAITVAGMKDASFNGAFTIGSVTATSITYPQAAVDATSGGGVVFGRRALRQRHNLAQAPLSTLVADATAALAAKPWTDAKARIEADIPQELRDCAAERAKVEWKRLANDTQQAAGTAKLVGDQLAEVDKRRRLFDAADAAFRDYVVNAGGRFDQALAIAARVADPKQNPLTAAETASIHSRKPDGSTDAALQTKRNDAAAARTALAAAQIDVDAKQTDLDLARLEALAKDLDANPEADAAVIAAKDALGAVDKPDTPLAKLNDAQNKFTTDLHTALTDWETAVPDTAWRNLADFEEAKRLLAALKSDPAPLVTAMDTAEADLVTALLAAEKAERTVDLLERKALEAASKARFASGSLPRRMLGALRGDS